MGLGTNRKNQNDWLPSKLDIESALLMAAENNTSGSSNNYPIIDCIGKTSLVINDNDNNGDSMSNNARGTNTNYDKNSMSSSFSSSSSSSSTKTTMISTFLLIIFSISVIITTTAFNIL